MAGAVFADVKRHLPAYRPKVVFDIGANIGQTVLEIRKFYSNCEIFSFEPVTASYDKLLDSTKADPLVHCFNHAMGREDGEVSMAVKGESTMNRIVDANYTGSKEMVPIRRGDNFCRQNGIDCISILKIDAEGHDLDVLVGFNELLGNHKIDFVQVEASMSPLNTRHVDISKFRGYLEQLGYYLFRINDQTFEMNNKSTMRRANLVFISKTCADGNPRT